MSSSTLPRTMTITKARPAPVEGNMAEPRRGEQGRAGSGEQIGLGFPDDWGDPGPQCLSPALPRVNTMSCDLCNTMTLIHTCHSPARQVG